MQVENIVKLLDENEICSDADFIKSQREDNFDYDFVKHPENIEKRGYRLEDYLFPATYDFQKNSRAKDIVNQMLVAFDERITSDVKSRLAELDVSLNDIITMASIIQKEAYGMESIKNIASDFANHKQNCYEAGLY